MFRFIWKLKRKNKKNYKIVILSKISVNKNTKKIGFIFNTDPSWKKGSHWFACYIDTDKDRSLEYYDSFARQPSKEFMENIKTVINKMCPNTYLKFKVNHIVEQ